jgi:hypothetical protein
MPGYDFSKSNLFLMVGGQIMLLVLVIMVVWFGVGPLQFAYADQMRNMLNIVPSAIPSAIPSANATSAIPSVNATSIKPSANGIK